MYRIDRIRKDGVDIIQLILCILYIPVKILFPLLTESMPTET